VARERRGRGIGRSLVTAMLTELRLQVLGQVSLSVETDNPAAALYVDLGFVARDAADGATTMVRRLR
jgi:ribosomal protein S18 acetylase RimI-like enzyme